MNRRIALTALAVFGSAVFVAGNALAQHARPAPSSRIAYSDWAPGGGFRQIFLINPDGSGKSQVTSETAKQHDLPAWSPDGSKIAATVATTAANYLKVIDVASGSYIEFPHPGVNGISWSNHKDGAGAILPWSQQLLVYGVWDTGSYFSNLTVRMPDGSGSPVSLTSCGFSADGTQMTSATSATWLPDSAGAAATRIAYTYTTYAVNSNGTLTLQSQQLRLMTLVSSAWPALSVGSDQMLPSVNSLPAGVNTPATLVWDRQGRQALWQKSGNQGFWLAQVGIDADGSPVVDLATASSLANSGVAASFSPDGSQICFLNNAGSAYTGIYKINTNNTGLATVYNKSKFGTGVRTASWGP